MRHVGLTHWFSGVVPPVAGPILLALTFLGDPVFLVGLAPAVYWLGPRFGLIDRHHAATLLGVTLGALALSVLLKYGFAIPRPPESLQLYPKDGYGFPSGHATGAAAVYGTLAALSTWRDRATRFALATSIVVTVSLTRLLLGVHYLVDVVAGITAGGLFAAAIVRLAAIDHRHPFRVAALIGLLTPLVLWPGYDAAAAVGAGVGALIVWELRGEALLGQDGWVPLSHVAVGFVVFGGLAGASYVLEPAAPLVVVANGITGAGFVGLPLVQNFSR